MNVVTYKFVFSTAVALVVKTVLVVNSHPSRPPHLSELQQKAPKAHYVLQYMKANTPMKCHQCQQCKQFSRVSTLNSASSVSILSNLQRAATSISDGLFINVFDVTIWDFCFSETRRIMMRVIGLTDLRRYLLAKSIDQPRRLTMTHCGDEEFTFGIFLSDQIPVIGQCSNRLTICDSVADVPES